MTNIMLETTYQNQMISFDTNIFEAIRGMRFIFLPDFPNYTIGAVSRDMCQHLEISKDTLIGKSVFEAFPPAPDDVAGSGQKKLRASLDYVLSHKAEHQMEQVRYDVQAVDGNFTERYWDVYNIPVLNDAGEVVYIIHTAEEVTDQIKAGKNQQAHLDLQMAYQSLQVSQTKYQSLFDSIGQGFCVFEMIFNEAGKPIDYRFLEVNAMFESQTGLKDAVGKKMRELVPDLEQYWFDLYGNVAMSGEAIRFEQGSEAMGRWFEVYAYRTGQLDTHQVAVLFTDITQRKRAEQALLEKDKAMHRIFQQAPVAIAIFRGPEFRVELANEAYLALSGRTAEQLLNKPLFDVFPETAGQGFEEILANVVKTGESYYAREHLAHFERAGSMVSGYFNFVYEALYESDGTISGVIVVATEITDQVMARTKAEESVQQTKALLESAPFPISVNVGENMLIQQANQAMLEAWSKGPEVIGKSLREVLPELDYNAVFDNYKQVLQTGIPFFRRNERFDLPVDGTVQIFYYNYSFTPLFDHNGSVKFKRLCSRIDIVHGSLADFCPIQCLLARLK